MAACGAQTKDLIGRQREEQVKEKWFISKGRDQFWKLTNYDGIGRLSTTRVPNIPSQCSIIWSRDTFKPNPNPKWTPRGTTRSIESNIWYSGKFK